MPPPDPPPETADRGDACAQPAAIERPVQEIFASHARRWEDFHYVYPVISRRSGGLSIGVNLNIDKACNFDCIYCCVDRSVPPVRRDVDLRQIRAELARMVDLATSGKIWTQEPFTNVPPRLRRINDIAFSGDGEPTTYTRFDEACRLVVDVKEQCQLEDVKIIVITNATMLDKPVVQRGLERLDAHNGEVWAKLDAGTEAYYQLVDQTRFPLRRVLANILACGRTRPVVIQSLFMQVHGEPAPDGEFNAYLDRLDELLHDRCQIKLVQLYTTARWTAQPWVSALTDTQLDRLASRLRARFPSLPAQVYYGVGS